ncbi:MULTISPECIES: hypothetical protein [unclassified Sphingomonas]|uniref:hypothetical protein n=1 Tax=unclassified Sphingomonas TaxID=196159 RepID=UPI000926D51F|nr:MULTISPECIES: hypothetical protein [unclassified Sphingomonas]MBN8849270.1 hypothetical protein [Sphingomonas sp.]MBS0284390.1 hypothetical protein [Pseudomonadota bacterium]OJV30019.1 MAG: hypothetical protein BGO24_13970 [Sphingomonas sp. 67-36]
MRKLMLALGAMSLAVPVSFAMPVTSGAAQAKTYKHKYRGVKRCRRSSGTTGLVAGGVGGALVGSSVLGHGALGTVAGAAGGALAGRAIDRTITAKKRCHYS